MKKLFFFILIFVMMLLLSGCKEEYFSLNYEGNEYVLTYNWYMENNSYVWDNITQEGTELHLKVFDTDTDKEFVYCDNSQSLYHKKNAVYPDNDTESINYLDLALTNHSQTISDKATIQEFINTTQGEAVKAVDLEDNLCSISIHYNEYPAYLGYGCIIKDTNQNYWLREDVYTIDTENINLEFSENYYPIPDDSAILNYI